MGLDEREDTKIYRIVINHEEQYALWPADREIQIPWTDTGKAGTKAEVLAWLDVIWPIDERRPLSLRKKMEEQGIEDTRVYQVLIDEGTGRYHAYPLEKGVPPGFSSANVTGSMLEMRDWVSRHGAAWVTPRKQGS
jgi:MbtH protein